MSKTFREEALPFIMFDENTKKFEINPDAVAMIQNLDQPLGVLSVAGMYRTGKSYLLNKMLLNTQKGFGVGPTVNPCTKGLWIWGRPVSGTTVDGKPIQILVIDTEGFGALDEDQNHDMKIFTLALLLSSFFLYNSMGSIDEAAVQSMNMVINLTKNIHLKSSGCEEPDTDEYASFLPQFLWVVRDFALQLCDEDGESITSKEYLEYALEEQKGFSDKIEQKNRIRRLLKSFFKDRDCVTMVRPLTNEDNLQVLDKLEMDQLRAEFVEQIMEVRKKVLGRIKPKSLNGNPINGKILIELAQTYVESINSGSVPNIENAWINITREQSLKSMNTVLHELKSFVSDNILNQLPMEEQEIKDFKIDAKDHVMSRYAELTKGYPVDIIEEFKETIQVRIKEEFRTIMMQNEKIFMQACEQFLYDGYSHIERKLKSGQFQGNFQEFVEELKAFQQFFHENGPYGPDRRQVMLEFTFHALDEAAIYFLTGYQSEIEVQKNLNETMNTRLDQEVHQVKQQMRIDSEKYDQKVRQLEFQNAQSASLISELEDQVAQYKAQQSKADIESRDRIENMRSQTQSLVDEYRTKLTKSEEQMKESNRKILMSQSEFEKERALMEQKISFLENRLEEFEGKGKQSIDDINSQKKQHQSEIKEIAARYDVQIKTLTKQLNQWQEKAVDLEGSYTSLEQKYEIEKQKWEDQVYQNSSGMNHKETQMQELQYKLETFKRQWKDEVDSLKDQLEEKESQLGDDLENTKNQLKDKENAIITNRNMYEKELAIYKQKIQFLQLQLEETKNSLEESKKNQDCLSLLMEEKNENFVPIEQHENIIESLKEQSLKDLKDKELEIEKVKKQYLDQIEDLDKDKEDLDLQYKILQTESEKNVQSYEEKIKHMIDQLEKSKQKCKGLETQVHNMFGESSVKSKDQIQKLEQELSEKEESFQTEMKNLIQTSEDQLAQLKQFYEEEKQHLEKRLTDSKTKADKHLSITIEEYEEKLREQQNRLEEEIEYLQEELQNVEMRLSHYSQSMESETQLQQQKIESLEMMLKEKEDRIHDEFEGKIQTLNTQIDGANQEKNSLLDKISQFQAQHSQKDREITALKTKLESIEMELERKVNDIGQQKSEVQNEKQRLYDEVENLREENGNIQNQAMQDKLEFEREMALMRQKLDFQENRISELSKEKNDISGNFELKIQTLKEEHSKTLEETLQKTAEGSSEWQTKYEEKRKQLKEFEQTIKKQVNTLEREKAVLEEKLTNAEKKVSETEEGQKEELVSLREQVARMNEASKKNQESIYEEKETLKASLNEYERTLQDVNNSYERDKLLWDEKVQFLEEQKNSYKRDLQEVQKKLDATLEKLQRNQEKMNNAENHQQLINTIENKFKQQLKDQNETHQKMYAELMEKNKNLERDNRQLRDRMQLEQRDQLQDKGNLEKKITDLVESEKRLVEELNEIKTDRDSKFQEWQSQMTQERETFKTKSTEMESKVKETEQKRSTLVFDFEKERTRFAMERDQLLEAKNDAVEQLQRAESKREQLLRENEKLKNENRGNRRMSMGRSGIMTGISNYQSNGSANGRNQDPNNTSGIGNFSSGNIESQVASHLKSNFTSFQAWKKERDVTKGSTGDLNALGGKENNNSGNLPNLPMRIGDGKGPVRPNLPLPRAPPAHDKSPLQKASSVTNLKTPEPKSDIAMESPHNSSQIHEGENPCLTDDDDN